MIRAAIFDLDGTIINTEESLVYAVNESLRQLGYPGTDREHVRSFIGHGGRRLIECAIKLYGNPNENDVDNAHRIYKKVFAEYCTYEIKAYEGVLETLYELKRHGLKLAVISNKSQQGVEACIHKVFGDDLFDIIRGERPGVPLKPDPAGLLGLIDELTLRPEECLYVGDGETDMQAGRRAGCITVGVTWGFRTREILEQNDPCYMIDYMQDLIPLAPFVYVIDGENMTGKDAFYDEVYRQLTSGKESECGHNLDAFADVLSGGFGKHDIGEPFGIVWNRFRKGIDGLGEEFVMKAVRIMLNNSGEYDCILKIQE